eukprot:gene2092-17664_t
MEVALGVFDEPIKKTSNDLDEDFLSRPATTALEYLRQVQREAAQCPDVVVATQFTRNEGESIKNQYSEIRSRLTPAPSNFIPNLAWQREQASNFAEIRQQLNYFKSRGFERPLHEINDIQLPNRTSEGAWCRFCLGKEKFQEVERRKRGQSGNATGDARKDDSDNENPIGAVSKGNDPLLSIVTRMNQCTVTDVLEYNVTWLQYIGFSERQGKWLFALLVCLEKPLLPSVSSLLRNLARRCADLRASLSDENDTRLPPLNLIITVVTR